MFQIEKLHCLIILKSRSLMKIGAFMYKTISELSKELHVSRQAIHQAVDKLLDKNNLSKKGNSFILDDRQQAIIRNSFDFEIEEPPSESSSKTSSDLTSNLITILQDQNTFLEREIENKNKQINELHILLLKEKEMHLLTQNKEEPMEEEKEIHPEKNQPKKTESEEVSEEPKKKRKWFNLFRRNE